MTQPVRIPADVDRDDTVLAGLTARQLGILSATGIVLYGLWSAVRAFVPVAVFLVLAVPVAATAVCIALLKRDGLSLDRLLLAAFRQRTTHRVQVAAPEGVLPPPAWLAQHQDSAPAPLKLPAEGVDEAGLVDLGADGIAVVTVCGTVNFALRTPDEQDALITAFGRYLHSLTAPVQILVRAQYLDLSTQTAELRQRATSLPHPALEAAAREHADFLDHLTHGRNLLCRQVLLVLREPVSAPVPVSPLAALVRRRGEQAVDPAARRAAEARLVRRAQEAGALLGPLGVAVTLLDAGQATAVLTSACNPDTLVSPSSPLAGADEVITLDERGTP
ncbi:PrgI family protein [Streptomyces roseirectus]|uniref:PrgI family protein n=1 Tax=Streptomyces roseirectus TaxID=2768066 RepID=A0A7H0IQE1_9ACTN|nr:PrgI family protein [Streptomyces roseirectus]QNP75007.1 PrgI family protein [Streptomyces roseirectus]